MDLSGFALQLLNGLASASTLFLVSAGLSLIFGVTRIVNFAHGSFYMLGIYLAYSLVQAWTGALGFWISLLLAGLSVGLIGAAVEMVLMRRLYRSPELFQLLATFALVLVIKDAALWIWGPEELLGPRAPGLKGSVEILGRQFPSYDLFLIVMGPALLGLVWLLLTRTRWGTLVRAATQDREMVSATRHGCSRQCLRWAPCWRDWVVPCSCRGNQPAWNWICTPSGQRLSWWWWVVWGRYQVLMLQRC